jgi:hypothetical protein
VIKRRKNDGGRCGISANSFYSPQNEKTTVLKIRDAQGFALKLHSGTFDHNSAKRRVLW